MNLRGIPDVTSWVCSEVPKPADELDGVADLAFIQVTRFAGAMRGKPADLASQRGELAKIPFLRRLAHRPAALLPEVVLEYRCRGEQCRFQSAADHDTGRMKGAGVRTAGSLLVIAARKFYDTLKLISIHQQLTLSEPRLAAHFL